MLGTDCVNQSSAATSNDKYLVPSVLDTGCTNMYEYPCQNCHYNTGGIRFNPNIAASITRRIRPQSNSTRSHVRRD